MEQINIPFIATIPVDDLFEASDFDLWDYCLNWAEHEFLIKSHELHQMKITGNARWIKFKELQKRRNDQQEEINRVFRSKESRQQK